jgi:hypothetical protein
MIKVLIINFLLLLIMDKVKLKTNFKVHLLSYNNSLFYTEPLDVKRRLNSKLNINIKNI